jgi:hypothetical protein
MNTNFQLRDRNNVTFLVCAPLERAGFVHAFSTRKSGVSPLPERALNLGYCQSDAPENVMENRRRFLNAIGAPAMSIITAKQIHSAEIIMLRNHTEANLKAPRVCDALMTGAPGLLLGVQTADCVPLLIADVKRRAVASIHAGWRGTRAHIAEKTIARMHAEFGTQPEDCLAAIGPAAGVCCYEVGAEVIGQFRSEFAAADSFISNHQPNGKAHLDLATGNVRQLVSAGMLESNIFASSLCTLCRNELFFSYRLEHQRGVGRMMSVIGVGAGKFQSRCFNSSAEILNG